MVVDEKLGDVVITIGHNMEWCPLIRITRIYICTALNEELSDILRSPK